MLSRRASLFFATAALAACSRSELDFGPMPETSAFDAGTVDVPDGSAPDQSAPDSTASDSNVPDRNVPDSEPPPCMTTGLQAPLGTTLWQTTLTSDRYLWGPFAADPSGATYFADDGSYLGDYEQSPTLLSLDGCGNLRWQVPWTHVPVPSGGIGAMVSGDALIAAYGDVEAFALSNGAHLWTADLSALGDPSTVYLRTLVGAANGAIYLTATTPQGVELVTIDAAGAASILATAPNAVANGTVTDLVLDASGHLDLSLTLTNAFLTPATPGAVDTFGRDGTLLLTTGVPNVEPWNSLLAGPKGFLNEGSGTWFLPDGSEGEQLATSNVFGAAMNAHGEIFASVWPPALSGDHPEIAKFDPTGAQVWSTPFPNGPINDGPGVGPVLGDGANVFFLAQSVDTFAIAALDVDTGAPTTWTFGDYTSGNLLLTPAGALVFTSGKLAIGLSSGGARPPPDAPWPTPLGGIDSRSAALGQ